MYDVIKTGTDDSDYYSIEFLKMANELHGMVESVCMFLDSWYDTGQLLKFTSQLELMENIFPTSAGNLTKACR